ncbi:MAG: hypothetical protein AAGA96_14680 [Verrucomicrobiota bacterium]
MALNLGFGGIGLLYGAILGYLRRGETIENGEITNDVFQQSLYWPPGVFLVMIGGLLLHDRQRMVNQGEGQGA